MPMGKRFAIMSDLNLCKIIMNGYEKHMRRLYEDDEPLRKCHKLFSLPRLNIAAITNDTVAMLASLAYAVKSLPNSRVAMGIIVGTGCNVMIPMKLSALHESKAKHVHSTSPDAEQIIANTKWSISGAASLLKELDIITKWDAKLDWTCAQPGFQPFEMIEGQYIGELIRLILHDYLTNLAGVPKDNLPATLLQPYTLTTTYISDNVAHARSDQDLANELNHSLSPSGNSQWSWNAMSAGVFRKIARTVQRRSAGLIAAAIVGLLACMREIELKVDSKENLLQTSNAAILEYNSNANPSKQGPEGSTIQCPFCPVLTPPPADWQSGPEELVVAYTGGIIQNYPNFKETCQQYIDRLIMRTGPQKSGKSVFLREALDGGVIGAGVLAGMVVDS